MKTSSDASDHLFRTMAEDTDILIAMSDETSNAIYFNKAWTELTGRSVEDLFNFGWADLIHEEDKKPFVDTYLQAFEKKEPWMGEFRVLNKDGQYKWIFAKASVRHHADGSFAGYISSSTDITEHVTSLKKVEEAETKARVSINSANLGVYEIILATDEMITDKRFKEIWGVDETVKRDDYVTVIHPDDVTLRAKAHEASLKTGSLEYQARVIWKDQSVHWVKVNGKILYDHKNNPVKLIGVVKDVTLQVTAQQKLEEGAYRLRSIVENAPFPIGVYVGQEMRIELANQSILDAWGKGNDVIGKSYKEILPELGSQDIFQQLESVYNTGIPFHAKNQRVDLVIEGKLQPFYFNYSFTPMSDLSGRIYGVMNTAANITELTLAKLKVQDSEENLRNTILKAPVAMCIFKGPNHVVELANERMFELWGRPAEDVMNKPIFEGLPEAKDQGFEALLDGVYTTGEAFSAQDIPVTLPRNGKIENVFVNFLYEAFREESGSISGVLAVAVDVTAQALARKVIEGQFERFKTLSEAMPQIVWTAQPDGNLDYFSKQWWTYSGLNFEQSVGQGWASTIHEEDIQRFSNLWTYSLQTGEQYQVEARVRRADGVYRWFLIRALAIKENGNIVQWIGTCTDIQEQKRSEKELRDLTSELAIVNEEFQASNEELSEANQHLHLINSDLDNFIYTASHDLKAPISNIEGLMLALKQSLPQEIIQEEEVVTLTTLIDASVERFKKTINQLTDITQLQKEFNLEASEVSFEEILEDVLLDLQIFISKTNTNLEIDSSIHTTIHFSHKNLRSIVYNLLSNAIKYSSPERLPHIKISCENLPGYQVLTISDNGLGIDLTNESKLFAMFGRLHDHVEGSGVGLYIVKKMLDNAGGRIEVESQVGIGSTFRVFFKNKNLKSKRL